MAEGAGDDTVHVGLETVLGTAGWMDSVAEDINNDVQSLMRQVRNLLDRWQGDAAGTHSDAWTEWFNSANNLVGALEDDAKALRWAAAAYGGTDHQTAGNVRRAAGETNAGSGV